VVRLENLLANYAALTGLERTVADQDGPFRYHEAIDYRAASFDTCAVYWHNLTNGDAASS
jgi:hypothetical protein